jgi:plasmid stability protein
MTLTLELTPDLEQRLIREAAKLGVPAEELTLELLRQHLPSADRRAQLMAAFRSWMEGDAAEQRETGEYLIRTLDEDRLSDRKLFPADLKGVTW